MRLCLVGLAVTWCTRALSTFDPTSTKGEGPDTDTTATTRAASGSMMQLASANVTSLHGIWDLLLEMPFDLLAMQELHIHDIVHWKAQAVKAGMQLIVGEPGPDGEYLVGAP